MKSGSRCAGESREHCTYYQESSHSQQPRCHRPPQVCLLMAHLRSSCPAAYSSSSFHTPELTPGPNLINYLYQTDTAKKRTSPAGIPSPRESPSTPKELLDRHLAPLDLPTYLPTWPPTHNLPDHNRSRPDSTRKNLPTQSPSPSLKSFAPDKSFETRKGNTYALTTDRSCSAHICSYPLRPHAYTDFLDIGLTYLPT